MKKIHEKQSISVIYCIFPSAEQTEHNPDFRAAKMLQEMEGATGIQITTNFDNPRTQAADSTKTAVYQRSYNSSTKRKLISCDAERCSFCGDQLIGCD